VGTALAAGTVLAAVIVAVLAVGQALARNSRAFAWKINRLGFSRKPLAPTHMVEGNNRWRRMGDSSWFWRYDPTGPGTRD
jgi:hypothetical protein